MNIIKMSYEKVYEKYYKRLPKIVAVIVTVFIAFIGVADVLAATEFLGSSYDGILSFIVGNEVYTSGIFAFIIWAILAVALYFIIYIVSKIAISQKIMVVQRLTEIKEK
ncbi:MAG: hypothetical protein GX051_04960 [Clostridiales bacterium]|nr:hypothetical protein [Clostridiales bacterium]